MHTNVGDLRGDKPTIWPTATASDLRSFIYWGPVCSLWVLQLSTFLQCIFPLCFIWLFLPVVSFCKFQWLICFLGGSFCSETSFPGWMRLCLNQWGPMASEKKVDENDASSQFKMAGRDNGCSDFSPSAVSSQGVQRNHFQLVSVLCQLHLFIIHHLRPFSFCNFCYPFQWET